MAVELRHLHYLLAVAETGTFSGAARRLRLSQPTLSVAVARLERQLGGALLDRGPRGVTLTPAGAAAVEHARRVLAAVAELESAVRPLVSRQQRPLRIGLFLGGVGELTVPLLQALPASLPGMRSTVVPLSSDELVTPLLDDEVDLTLGWGPLADERLLVTPLFEEERVVVVGAGQPLADAPEATVADLLEMPHAGSLDGEPPDWENWWNLVPERSGEQPRRLSAPEATDQVSQLRGHALRPTIATVPAHVSRAFPGEFLGLRYVPVPGLPPASAVLVTRRAVNPVVEAVARTIVTLARELSTASPQLIASR